MEKTFEEKRSAVLAYCEEICPNEGDSINLLGDAALIINCGGSLWKLTWKYMDGKIWLAVETSDWLIDTAYRLLGLDKRDAVEAERGKAAKLVEALDEIGSFATDEEGDEMDAFDMGQAIGEMVDKALKTYKEGSGK